MSMNIEARPPTAQEQGVEATRRLRAVLGLAELSPAALKLLSAAVAVVAADEAERNASFADKLRAAHERLSEKPPKVKKPRQKPPVVELRPIGYVDMSSYDPYGPLDPYLMLRLYGHHQLALALSRYALPKLKQALVIVEAQNPGTKPASRSSKNAIIEYLVAHVGGS